MQIIENREIIGLGSRLKKLSDSLYRQYDEVFQSRHISLSSRHFPLLQVLAGRDAVSVTHLAEELGQTHPAISQMSKKLEREGWLYHHADTQDERRRMLALTPKGFELVDRLLPVWEVIETVINRILGTSSYGLIDNIQLIEREINKMSLKDRVELFEREQKSREVEIIHFEARYAQDFYQLNRHWLEKYFYVESIDDEVLKHPQEVIIDKGGYVLLARLKNKIIGTAALIKSEFNGLELSKMSVDESFQGLGIGEKLAHSSINQFKATDNHKLFLESNRKLLPALNLYRKLGFVEKPSPFETSHYNRADIYMEYEGRV